MTDSSTLPRHLVVLDVDSTLIDQEVIELLATQAGSLDAVAMITARAMNGEIDFAESLRERVATLAGLPISVFDEARRQATFTVGARELALECARRDWPVALVSGGFEEVVASLAAEVGISRFRANGLEVVDGHLTGRTRGPIIDAAAKAATLRDFAQQADIPMSQTIAIGDGANDLQMISAAAVGIAFCAKPIVVEQAPYQVAHRDLRAALNLADAVIAGTYWDSPR